MRNTISLLNRAFLAFAFIFAGLATASAQVPVITAQPQSASAVLGLSATFSVTASNALSYQWRKESALIPGATGSVLALASVKYADAGNYSVLVANTNGTVAGSNATLTVTAGDSSGVDYTFNPGSGANATVRAVTLQSDGKVLLGGSFSSVSGQTRNRIARLNADGSLDAGFQSSMTGANGDVRAVAVQPDGKVLIGGAFTTVNGTNRTSIARLNGDGSLDLTFNPGSGATNGAVYAVAVRAGKVLIGGSFRKVNGVTRNGMAQLNADGSLDGNFQLNLLGAGASGSVYAIAVQADGKVLVGGDFTNFNNTARYRIARLNAFDGTLDSFQNSMAGADAEVHSVVVQPDGKVLVGGYFTRVNGTTNCAVARLSPADGSLDSTFIPDPSSLFAYPYSQVEGIALQTDGTVLLGGWFYWPPPYSSWRGGFGILNSDGSFIVYPVSRPVDGTVYSLAAQPDGKVLLGGDFTLVSGTVSRNRIARLGTGIPYSTADADGDGISNALERQYGLNPEVPNLQVGSGRDGAVTVESGDYYTDNTWARVLGANPAGSATLNVSTTNGFGVSNLVLMITMQATNLNFSQNAAGTYEFGRIASLGNNTFTLTAPRSNAFSINAADKAIQVVRVPEYTDVTATGAALSFDGSNDYVQAAIPPLSSNYTFSAWVFLRTGGSTGGGRNVVGVLSSPVCGGSAEVMIHSTASATDPQYIELGRCSSYAGVISTNAVPANQWVHIAVTVSSNKLVTYFINGSLAGSWNATGYDVTIGPTISLADNTQRKFDGRLDEVQLWSKAQSQSDITNNLRRALTGEEPGLVAYYRFNEGSGITAHDATLNHLDGTLMNSPVWVPPGSLTCHPWNGTNGGVLTFLAHNVTLGSVGVISADGKGYRGGTNVPAVNIYEWGVAGEGTTGFTNNRATTNTGWVQGGGGASRGAAASGGGGGYGSGGQSGGYSPNSGDTSIPGLGAAAFGTNSLTRLYPGGGGGGSGSHDANRVGVRGGAGGGIVLIAAGFMGGNGTISALGAPGSPGIAGNYNTSGSGGGGGAGGSVYLIGSVANSLQILATGGAGGLRAAVNGADGGAGGMGRIRLDVPVSGAAMTNVSPAPGCLAQLSASNTITALFWSGYLDSDNDGLDDQQELVLGTNPMNPDTDGDSIPDGWWAQWGLGPTNGYAVAPGNLLTYFQKYRYGLNVSTNDTDGDGLTDYQELFIYHTDPTDAHSIDATLNDSAAVAAGLNPRCPSALTDGDHYYYDALDRLVGVNYTNGLSLLYAYDGNDNLVRQAYLARGPLTDGVAGLWEQVHGLTNGVFADSDGDGYSDVQEWWAGTDPSGASSVPADPLGPAGSNITGGIIFPFTPSNCVVAVGQLDGVGAEEVVVSADGTPGTTTNFLLILSQTTAGWTTQRVDVGSQGVTSLAVGQPANRSFAAIYAGLRQQGGTGSVAEVSCSGGQWTLNTLIRSTNDAAYVLGVRPGRDVVVSLAQSNALPGTPYYLGFAANSWTLTRADTNTTYQRGLGMVSLPGLHGVPSRGVRLLDAGGLQVLGDEAFVPTAAIWNPSYSRWFFQTTNSTTWQACQSYAQLFGGNLATITDSNLNTWVWNRFKSFGRVWIGLRRESLDPGVGPWRWASGLPLMYTNWWPGQPEDAKQEGGAELENGGAYPGTWADYPVSTAYYGVAETAAVIGPSALTNEPPVFSRLPWRGLSLCAGDLRLTNALSILYATVADTNRNNVLDAGDDFMLTEYLFSGTNVFTYTIQRIPLSGTVLAPSYGLACVDTLSGNQQVLFTAEPDGRIFSWTATNATAPLTRQLFSRHDQGLAWHALAAVRTLDPGQSLLGLRVDPVTPNRCDVILWPPVSKLSAPPDYPQTAPITQILPAPNAGTNGARVDIRLWDGEADPARVTLQYQRPYETAWLPATMDLTGYLATYPTGVTHTVVWNAALDLGPGFANTVQLRARAQDISLVGDWSGAVPYQVTTLVGNHPHAYPDSAITDMNQWVDIDVLANDTVENSAPKFIYSVGSPSFYNGTVFTNFNSTVRYVPAWGFVGTDQFSYTLTDGAAYSEATVTVTVTPAVVVLALPALHTNAFSLLISGPAGAYQVLASTNLTANLTNWSLVAWVTNVSGTVPFSEAVPTDVPARFYRARLVP